MHGANLFILTTIEILSIILIWCKINKWSFKDHLLAISVYTLTIAASEIITDYYGLSGSYMYILFLAGALFALRESFKQTIVILVTTLAIAFAIQSLLMAPFLLSGMEPGQIYNFGFAIKIDVVLLAASSAIYRWAPLDNLKAKLSVIIDEIMFISINLMIVILFVKISWDLNKQHIWDQLLLYMVIGALLIITQIIFAKTVLEKKKQEKTIEIQNQYNPIIIELLEEVKRKQHDFKNHLNTLYGIVMVQEGDAAKEKVREYMKNLTEFLKNDDTLIYLNNKMLAGILYSKLCQANQMGIGFRYEIKDELMDTKLQDYQLSIILNNLIDNAFEAIAKIENEEDRNVTVRTWTENDKSIIAVENSSMPIRADILTKVFDRGFSTKGSSGRGYGLYNVKKTIESAGGLIQLRSDDASVEFRIII